MSTWTEERVGVLKSLWGNGKSASEIAEILGGVTRNAVIGKAHRLGLSAKKQPVPPKRRIIAKVEPEIEPITGGATIMSLTDRMCKWPIGDPKSNEFRFCGRSVRAGYPYCQEHVRVAYQPARKRDDDRASGGGSA